MPIRVFVVDDHPVVRAGLKMLLSGSPDVAIVGEAASQAEAQRGLSTAAADVVLLDLDLGVDDGTSLIAWIREAVPRSAVLVVTGIRDPQKHRQVLLSGARGLVLKDKSPEVLLKAVERVHAGDLWFDRGTVDAAIQRVLTGDEKSDPNRARIASLTPREREMVTLIGEGLKNAEIARRLGIGEKTVRNVLSIVFDKLGVADRLELLVYAYRNGLIEKPR